MKKALAAGVVLAIVTTLLPGPAATQSLDLSSKGTERLLRQLLPDGKAASKRVLVTRSAAVRVQGTITKTSGAMTLPLLCTLRFSYYDEVEQRSRSESKTKEVAFVGSVGTCDVNVPFKWEDVDVSGLVEVGVRISNEGEGDTGPRKRAPGASVFRTSLISFPPISVPAQNTTTELTFDTRM